MTKMKGLGVVLVFGLGVGLGCAAAPLVVPKASAQQAATLTKWEYHCDHDGTMDIEASANKAGSEGWELAAASGANIWCFKRRKM